MVSIQDPKVSIGLPVFNGEKYLREAIDSILAQTFTDFELIISDNASTDRTEEICKEYEAKDPRVRYYRNELNLGAAPNYNRLVELSRGEYFKWACHDDLCAPEFLEKCVEILEQNSPIILCYTRTLIIDENGKPILDDFGDDLNLQMPKPHERYGRYHEALFCSGPKGCDRTRVLYGLIRSSSLKKTKLLGSYLWADWVLVGELALWGQFYEVSLNLFMRRVHPQASMQANLSLEDRNAWYNSLNKGATLPSWRLLFEFLSSINRAQLNWYTKINCYLELRKWLLSPFGWRKMARDVRLMAIRWKKGGSSGAMVENV